MAKIKRKTLACSLISCSCCCSFCTSAADSRFVMSREPLFMREGGGLFTPVGLFRTGGVGVFIRERLGSGSPTLSAMSKLLLEPVHVDF